MVFLFFLVLWETLISETNSLLVGVSGVSTMGDGRRWVYSSLYKRCVDATPAWPRRAAYVEKPEGGFQRLANPKDTSPYYFKLTVGVLVMTMRGRFLLRFCAFV